MIKDMEVSAFSECFLFFCFFLFFFFFLFKEIDFALADFSVTKTRASVSEQTTPYIYVDIVLITGKLNSTHDPWAFYIRPFSLDVYLLIFGKL